MRVSLIVTASVATGYGQPPSTHYDWTLAAHDSAIPSFQLPEEAEARLLIEQYCNQVTKTLYANEFDPLGLPSEFERSGLMSLLASDLKKLESKLKTHSNHTCQSNRMSRF